MEVTASAAVFSLVSESSIGPFLPEHPIPLSSGNFDVKDGLRSGRPVKDKADATLEKVYACEHPWALSSASWASRTKRVLVKTNQISQTSMGLERSVPELLGPPIRLHHQNSGHYLGSDHL
ncbi:hypothetical protein EVAR_85349_1 [Eumeta japonica]|uniref:Uncharacterized protein n=1 Tax=Eumeta variegata TaxID=151549 RepID=A0A4C1WRC5_EUMVA|nr:hypothetical protein EVAR_85349_1 [Eumeta japonica]